MYIQKISDFSDASLPFQEVKYLILDMKLLAIQISLLIVFPLFADERNTILAFCQFANIIFTSYIYIHHGNVDSSIQ